jgi:O-antigen/teichoic acid export membrane protein
MLKRKIVHRILQLGSGEALARAFGIATIILLSHRYGVVLLGVFALAQSLSQYSQPLIDFGLRHVGARLIAIYPQAQREIMKRVQRRRLLMAGIVLPFILIYAAFAKMPLDMKIFLMVFAAISGAYAISLDWAAWGKEQLWIVGLAKAIVPGSILVCLAAGLGGESIFWWLVLGNAVGYVLQAVMFWVWWRRSPPAETVRQETMTTISESLAWRKTSVMGLAWLGNLAFVTIDVLMLGVLSNPEQVGLYSAAYRVLNQVLITYYLVTQAVYPQLARHDASDRIRMLRANILWPLAGMGVALALVLAVSRRPILAVLFGHPFLAAAPLLLLLVWVIPLDFVTAWMSNAYLAWGMERRVLLCTTIAAGSNMLLNLVGIPRYGAMAAAVNTLISYLVFLACLAWMGRASAQLARPAQPRAEMCA